MPRLPSADDLAGNRPSLRVAGGISAARPTADIPRLGSEAEGDAVLAKTIGNVGERFAAIAEKDRERQESLRVEDSFNQLRAGQLDLTLGEQNGFNKLKGGDAVNRPLLDEWTQKFDTQAKRLEDALPGDLARQRFRQRAAVARQSFQGDILRHVAHESDIYAKGVFQTTIDTETRNIGASPEDEITAGIATERVLSAVSREADRLGQDPKMAAAKAMDHLWVARLEAWRVNDPVGALNAFQDHSAEIGPETRRKLAESLFRDAAPVLASTLRQQKLETFASTESEAQAIAERANRANLQVSVTVNKPAGMVEQGNINLLARPIVKMDDGSIATVRSMSFAEDGKTILVPTVSDDGRVMSDDEAYEQYKRTGRHLGKFTSEKEATAYAKALSKDQGKIYGGGGVFDRLPLDHKLLLLDMAHAQSSQDMAQLRANLHGRVQDATAALERGLAAPEVPTSQELMQAFGAEQGARVSRSLDQARAFGDDYIRISSLPRSEQQARLSERQPAPGVGFAEAQQRQEQLAGAIDRVRREQEQDPAGFVLQGSPVRQRSLRGLNRPDVVVAYEAMVQAQNDPKVTADTRALVSQRYAAATLAEQARLEIPNPQILPKPMVDSIAKRFAEPPSEGENFANVVRGMVDQWGSYWPVVGRQLKGKIPPEAEVIALGVTSEAEAALAQAVKLKPEALRQGIQEPDVKDLRELIRREFEPLQRSIVWQEGGIQTYDNFADSAEKIGIGMMQKGMKPKDAAKKAFESLAGFKYEFEDTWRVPKASLGGETTMAVLRTGAEAAKRDIGSESPVVGDKVKLLVPAVPGAVRASDAEKQWRETIVSNGFWVTSPGDGGLTLYVKSGLGAQPVLDDRGLPVRRTWQEISAVGNSVRAAHFRDVYKASPQSGPVRLP